ncbi:MAG TPA: alpha/beta fold hydrolase [Holophagaceae bacterium]|jgi:predicted dienelactone hydrolase|nr:alpha/beta fold hydrolase [Holophagaceae bacterium]
MKTCTRKLLIWLSGLLVTTKILAAQAGWAQMVVPGATRDDPSTIVALYYPTQTTPSRVAMGPYVLHVAIQAPPDPSVKGLIVLSHGMGGSELCHSSLAEALARAGYLVAALRHPGDNWQDSSLLQESPARYFDVRPRQVSGVIDALLLDPKWKDRIARDAKGPRIGAVGHSAGGYTVLALAGGTPDIARLVKHFKEHAAEDPIFSGQGRSPHAAAPPAAPAPAYGPLQDRRIRAVVAMAPIGVVLTPESLARITVPTVIYEAESDRFLVPRFHAEWIAQNMPRAELRRVPNAWHFAFLDTPSQPIPTPDGDIGANPPGFDRTAFLAKLGIDLAAFFDRTLQ